MDVCGSATERVNLANLPAIMARGFSQDDLAAGTLKPLLAIVPSALPPVAPEVIQPVAAEKANSIPAELPDIAPIPIPVDPRRAPTKTPQAPAALAA